MLLIAVSAALVTITTGCGGSGSSTPPNSPVVSPGQSLAPSYVKPADIRAISHVVVNTFNDNTTHYSVDGVGIEPTSSIIAYFSVQQSTPLIMGLLNERKIDYTVLPPVLVFDAYLVPELSPDQTQLALYLVDNNGNILSSDQGPEVIATLKNGLVVVSVAGSQISQVSTDPTTLITALLPLLPTHSTVSGTCKLEEADGIARYVLAYVGPKK